MAAASTRVRLRVSPGAGRAQVVGRHGDAWKVRVTAAPEHGRANDAVLRLLAEVLAVPARHARARFGPRGAGQDRRIDRARAGARRAPPCVRIRARPRQKGPATMSIDTDRFQRDPARGARARRACDREPARGSSGHARRRGRGDLRRERQPSRRDRDRDARPRDRLHARGELRAGARRDRRGAEADRRRHIRHVRELQGADRGGAARGVSVGVAVHRVRTTGGAPVSERPVGVAARTRAGRSRRLDAERALARVHRRALARRRARCSG